MSQWRILVAAALGGAALYLVGAVALGSPPTATDSPAQVVAWFRDHHDAARLYAWTAALGTLAFAVVAGIVRGTLPAPFRDVFLLAPPRSSSRRLSRRGAGPGWHSIPIHSSHPRRA